MVYRRMQVHVTRHRAGDDSLVSVKRHLYRESGIGFAAGLVWQLYWHAVVT